MFASKIITVLALCAVALGADVYSTFQNADGSRIGNVNYDIANNGCFSVASAQNVGFSQAGDEFVSYADGPYCLSAWASGFCDGEPTQRQEFSKVALGGQSYLLIQGVHDASSYQWAAAGCP